MLHFHTARDRSTHRRRFQFQADCLGLEDRTLLSASPLTRPAAEVVIASTTSTNRVNTVNLNQNQIAVAERFVNNVYYDLLGRAPTSEELTRGVNQISRGQVNARVQFVRNLLRSDQFRANQIAEAYQRYLGREVTDQELQGWLRALGPNGSVGRVELALLSGPSFFRQAGGTNAAFVQALFESTSGQVNPRVAANLVANLDSGRISRTDAARTVLFGSRSAQAFVNSAFNRVLYREADAPGLATLSQRFQATRRPEAVFEALATSREYLNLSARANGDLVDTAASAGIFNTLLAAVGAAGLEDTLRGEGPFTVFAPTDAAFAALPAGLLDALLLPENRPTLTRILTYHVVPAKLSAPELLNLGSAPTVEGNSVTVSLNNQGNPVVNQAGIVAVNVLAFNGFAHAIDQVLLPPGIVLPS